MRYQRGLLVAAALYVLAVLYLVLWPQSNTPSSVVRAVAGVLWSVGLSGVTTTAVEFAFNVLLLVPLGVLGALSRPHVRWWGWLTVGLGLSVAFEGVQWVLLPDRSATVADVVANTAGCALGAVAAPRLRARTRV